MPFGQIIFLGAAALMLVAFSIALYPIVAWIIRETFTK